MIDRFLNWMFLKIGNLVWLLFFAAVVSILIGGTISLSYAGLSWMHRAAAESDR